MKNLIAFLIAIVVVLVSMNFYFDGYKHKVIAQKTISNNQAVYDRVIESGKIRCGYALWSPALMQDPNTGEFSGIFYDYLNAVGTLLDLEIEWTVEANLATYLQDLNNGRFDMECSGGWPNAYRGKFADFTTPIYFTPVYLYMRADDMRFDDNIRAINDPSVRFTVMDGETSAQLRDMMFPNSTAVGVPPINPLSELLDTLRYNKSDVTLLDSMSVSSYMAKHPGILRQVQTPPLRVIPNNMAVPANAHRFRTMIDIATQQLLYDGVIDRILDKYNVTDDKALRVAMPYRLPSSQSGASPLETNQDAVPEKDKAE